MEVVRAVLDMRVRILCVLAWGAMCRKELSCGLARLQDHTRGPRECPCKRARAGAGYEMRCGSGQIVCVCVCECVCGCLCVATHVHVYVALSSPQLRETWMRGEQQMDQLVCVSLSSVSMLL